MPNHLSFRFIPGLEVETKFRTKKVKATIVRFTKKNVVLLYNGKEKSDDLQSFVKNNSYTEIVFRIEKNGIGPYQTKEGSKDFLEWKKTQRDKGLVNREQGIKHIQPCPEFDLHLQDYPMIGSYCKFAFQTYDQMFNWFSLADLSLLAKEGFRIVTKQKGLDYYHSFYSSHQIALAETEEEYKKVELSRRNF